MEDFARGFGVGYLAGVVFVTVAIALLSLVREWEPRHTFEAEAVQHGAAEWSVDADGERVFRWKGEP